MGNPPKIHVLTVIFNDLRTQVKDDPNNVLGRYWVSRDHKFILEILDSQDNLSKFFPWTYSNLTNRLHVCSCQVLRRGSEWYKHENEPWMQIHWTYVFSQWVRARRFHLPSILCFYLNSVLIDLWNGKWDDGPFGWLLKFLPTISEWTMAMSQIVQSEFPLNSVNSLYLSTCMCFRA